METITGTRTYDVQAGRRYALAMQSDAGANVSVQYVGGSGTAAPFRDAAGNLTTYSGLTANGLELLAPTPHIRLVVSSGTLRASLVPLL